MRLSSILTAAALVAVGTSAFAQISNSGASSTASNQQVGAKILTAIVLTGPTPSDSKSVVDSNQMHFGRIVKGANTVTLSPNTASRTATTTGALVGGASPADVYCPTYNVVGESGEKFTIVVGDTEVKKNGTLTGADQKMAVTQFTYSFLSGSTWSADALAAASTAALTAPSGNWNFRLGAQLAVSANQETGAYWGTYNLTVAYN